MNSFHRFLIHLAIGVMVFGMVGVATGGPIPRESNPKEGEMKTEKKGMKTSLHRSIPSAEGGCRSHSPQRPGVYLPGITDSYETDCSSPLGGESAWIYAPGCMNFRALKNSRENGHCSADEQLVTNVGNLVVHSSDRVLGRVDTAVDAAESEKSFPDVVPVSQQELNSWNNLSPTNHLNRALIAKAFRYDRLGKRFFDGEEYAGSSLAPDFDHQLVMSGKLARLVPKSGQTPRTLELGDLVFLLLFAILPEKKQIRHLFRCARQLKMMGFNSFL